MMAMGQSKFILGDQHHLYEILLNENWNIFPWRIATEEENLYWVPIKHLESTYNKSAQMDGEIG